MDQRVAEVESLLMAFIDDVKVPGVQYVLVDAAQVRCEIACGWADIGLRRPMQAATTLMAYSMSKTITAVAVLQLVETGVLDLDAPVEAYLPALPYATRITIRQLLSHTSGLPNPIPLRWVHAEAEHAGFDEAQALEAVVRRHARLAFEPGAKYGYSNIGYWLLGSVVETASGMTFREYVTDRIVRPLGLGPDEMGFEVADADRHAAGYLEKYSMVNVLAPFLVDKRLLGPYEGRWRRIRSHYANGPAFGGLVGTARSFGRFLQDQLGAGSILLGKVGMELLREEQRTSQGRAVPMTLGWHVRTVGGERVLFKEGGGGGFHCLMRLYPAWGLGSVLMTNATTFDVAECLDTVDPLFSSDRGPA